MSEVRKDLDGFKEGRVKGVISSAEFSELCLRSNSKWTSVFSPIQLNRLFGVMLITLAFAKRFDWRWMGMTIPCQTEKTWSMRDSEMWSAFCWINDQSWGVRGERTNLLQVWNLAIEESITVSPSVSPTRDANGPAISTELTFPLSLPFHPQYIVTSDWMDCIEKTGFSWLLVKECGMLMKQSFLSWSITTRHVLKPAISRLKYSAVVGGTAKGSNFYCCYSAKNFDHTHICMGFVYDSSTRAQISSAVGTIFKSRFSTMCLDCLTGGRVVGISKYPYEASNWTLR